MSANGVTFFDTDGLFFTSVSMALAYRRIASKRCYGYDCKIQISAVSIVEDTIRDLFGHAVQTAGCVLSFFFLVGTILLLVLHLGLLSFSCRPLAVRNLPEQSFAHVQGLSRFGF